MYDENPGRAQAGAPPRPARGTGNGRAASTVTTKKNSTTTNTSAGIIGTSTSATPSGGKALPLRCLGSLDLQTTGGDKKNSKKKALPHLLVDMARSVHVMYCRKKQCENTIFQKHEFVTFCNERALLRTGG